MKKNEQIKKLLEEANNTCKTFMIGKDKTRFTILCNIQKNVEQALALLDSPETSELVKEARKLLKKGADDNQWKFATLLRKACDEIDRLTAELEVSKEEIKELREIYLKFDNYCLTNNIDVDEILQEKKDE